MNLVVILTIKQRLVRTGTLIRKSKCGMLAPKEIYRSFNVAPTVNINGSEGGVYTHLPTYNLRIRTKAQV